MGILIEGLKNLKIIREKRARELMIAEEARCSIDRLIELYNAIDIKCKRIQSTTLNDEILANETDELHQMKGEFTYCWNRLSKTEQDKLIQKLIDLQLLPELLRDSLEILGGRFIIIV